MLRLFRRTYHFVRRTMPPPDRWEEYTPMGSVIPGTKFVAFKVPLKEELLRQVDEKDRFSPGILMKLLEDRDLKLGGVIDLTFTFKYYNKEEFLKNSVGHTKIFTPGHHVPSESVFQQFAHAVKTFDADKKDEIIGVHCTHGVNRTGYLICRYMIEEMSFEPEVAISLFGKARGHELERENYLEDLKNRKCGQSTYDPNFQVPEEDLRIGGYSGSQRPRKDKSRWRHHREDHPTWKRSYHNSTEERGLLDAPVPYIAPLYDQRITYPDHSRYISQSASEAPLGYSQSINYSGWGPSGQYLGEERFSRSSSSYYMDRSVHDVSHSWRDNADRNSCKPRGRNDRRGGSDNRFYGQRFNPIYNNKCPDGNKGRRDDYRHGDKKDSLDSQEKDTQPDTSSHKM